MQFYKYPGYSKCEEGKNMLDMLNKNNRKVSWSKVYGNIEYENVNYMSISLYEKEKVVVKHSDHTWDYINGHYYERFKFN